jgi:hypothetical protein
MRIRGYQWTHAFLIEWINAPKFEMTAEEFPMRTYSAANTDID